MSFLDDIVYGLELEKLGEHELLVQICLRQDRTQPDAEASKLLATAQELAAGLVNGYADDLESEGFTDLAARVRGVIA